MHSMYINVYACSTVKQTIKYSISKEGQMKENDYFFSPIAIAAWQIILQNIKNKAGFSNTKSKALIKHNVN